MLTNRHWATIRAALRFWREEISIHDVEVARPYFEAIHVEPLSGAEIDVLYRTIATVRYGVFDPQTDRLQSTELIEYEAALTLGQNQIIATVFLPG